MGIPTLFANEQLPFANSLNKDNQAYLLAMSYKQMYKLMCSLDAMLIYIKEQLDEQANLLNVIVISSTCNTISCLCR